jgi:hypothetical protein
MDKPKVTPKDFFLWFAAMLFLYAGVFNYVALVWDYINYSFPDPLQYYPSDPYQSGISWEMASLIVLAPLFLVLMWWIHRSIKADSTRGEIWIRRWALYLTLFVAGVTIAVDLIYVLYAFLSGTDLTARFLLKALVVLAVAAVGFMHFLADLWGYWEQFPGRNRFVALATALLVAITVIAGFFIVGTPAQARLYRFDEQKVSDLTSIQYQIVNYWQSKQRLPISLSDLNDSISNFTVPNDAQSGKPYTYKITGAHSFQLCATFNAETHGNNPILARPSEPMAVGEAGKPIADNWLHGAGEACFDRAIDPERYPPFSKQKTL